MPEDTVHTDADHLLTFVKEKGEMSIQDIAKELKLSPETLESLAELLEEEGLVQIKYKFTTPYILPAKPKEDDSVREKAEVVAEKESVAEAGIGEKIKLDEKAEIKKAEPSKIPAGKGGIPLAPGPRKAGEKREPAAAGEGIDKELEAIKGKSIEEEVDKLIELANSFISRGDFESARKVYMRIRQIKNELPVRIRGEEQKVNEGIASINENIVVGMDRALSGSFSGKEEKISSLLNEAQSRIKNGKIGSIGDLKAVETIYHQIKEIYLSLPEGFMEKKISIQDRMLTLYKAALLSKRTLLSAEFEGISGNIISMLSKMSREIAEKRLTDANSTFSAITELYKAIPEGFVKQKTELQARILDNYQKLILDKESVYSSELVVKAEEIKAQLKDAYLLVQRDKVSKALKKYRNAADIYATLPEGFFATRAEIEEQMLGIHHLLLLKQNKDSVGYIHLRITEIESMIATATAYIEQKDYDLAKEAYLEIISFYNSLPEGFIDLNLKVKREIVELYRKMIYSLKDVSGEMLEPDTARKYNELLSLLVQIHEHMRNKEFDRIKSKYLYSYRIYHSLPLGFIEDKMDIYKEIYKVYEELKLFTDVAKLAEYAENREFGRLRQMIAALTADADRLSRKYPEDTEFFRHVEGQLKTYLHLIYQDGTGGAKEATGTEVMKKIEKVAASSAAEMKAQVENMASRALPAPSLQEQGTAQKQGSIEAGAQNVWNAGAAGSADNYIKKSYNIENIEGRQ